MSTLELREKVFKKLEFVEDYVLEEVLSLLEFETNEGLYKLSEAQKSKIDEAHKQIKAGNSLTDDEVNKEIDEWLSK
ncbi:MAG: hypothetical protein IPK91_01050 [Saprospiraceae bacterium]|nr:hypothetical protein [Saprospiraceae bacterium]